MASFVRFAVLPFLAVFCLFAPVLAADNIKGWERGGAYDKAYDPKEADSFKGRVEDILEIVPLPGMDKGVALVVRDKKDNKTETVHLGPKSFVDLESIGLRKGDSVKVTGVWASIGGKEVVMASKVKKDEKLQLKVRRTKDGMPWWSMSADELAKERKSADDD
ncbi:hypothetical protein NNJEOMEG_02360 [Fundidesulfovibrio magnetotacticus]|uniref:Magnetosome protein MamS/MamX domain-containing protein n=1 Tax=Fundidesulfovibrio magnetotacticus TaxID=2730080 RepID=A0A6V8LS03_9BACT|nr:hypothetical protein [Fundidesulfovibrio magnetotacticus]GFK94514.1 hypothetical protein NNJEOMEG_02360 [Fundidesulfovibrio magnetotacticus]